MPQPPRLFGYDATGRLHDVLEVWRSGHIVEIEHAWLFDHLLPIGGDRTDRSTRAGPCFRPAAQTGRRRVGLLVTSNRFRPPAMLAKMAATVDVVSGGRFDFGIGAGSRPSYPLARREYEANGLPFHDSAHAVGSLAEACTVIRRLWTETEPFDFHGSYLSLIGAFCNPKPIQRPHPPILIGGRSAPVLRWSPSTPTCGTSPAGTSTTPSAAAGCWTATAPRSAATRRGHPLDPPARLLRPARHHPRGDRRGDRRRLPACRARTAGALSRQGRPVGHRRAHHHLGLAGELATLLA